MTIKFKSALCAAALLTGSAALAVTPIGNVNVDVDLDAIQNAKAANYWTDIADDLENEIVARLASQIEEQGASVSVDIDELSLANTFESTFGWEESYLIGDVSVSNLQDNSDHDFYTLKVSFQQAQAFFPEGVDFNKLTSDSPYYYESMIDAFADNVVEKLQ